MSEPGTAVSTQERWCGLARRIEMDEYGHPWLPRPAIYVLPVLRSIAEGEAPSSIAQRLQVSRDDVLACVAYGLAKVLDDPLGPEF